MILTELLGDIPAAKFLQDYYLRLPFSLPERAGRLREFGDWHTVETVLAGPEPDVLIVRQGQRWEGTAPPTPDEARRLFDEGHTLLVRHAERQHPQLAELADAFRRDFAAPVDIHLYCTPPGSHGFGWHYDAEDVFILQTRGSKEYSLRKNTVNPWPLAETLPADMQYEREIMPLLQCLLKAGDWLYIPNGYWHVARTTAEESFSLAVGLMTPPALDAFDYLRHRLLSSMLWRQRIPPTGEATPATPEELVETYRTLFAELGDDLARTFADERFVRSYLVDKGIV